MAKRKIPGPASGETTDPSTQGANSARGKASADARRDSSKLKKNQDRLGVDAEHMTETMRKRHRGTYP